MDEDKNEGRKVLLFVKGRLILKQRSSPTWPNGLRHRTPSAH